MKDIAIQAARAGGQVLMQKFGTTLVVEHKGENDLVTDVDRASEAAIVSVIRGTFPRHDILAEEGQYPAYDSRYRWIIDPLDGTTNYAHGFPWFAVSIALERDGEVILGVVHNPFTRELFIAEKGEGAFLNDIQIRVSRTAARITSYNVCYTKLLRLFTAGLPEKPSSPGWRANASAFATPVSGPWWRGSGIMAANIV